MPPLAPSGIFRWGGSHVRAIRAAAGGNLIEEEHRVAQEVVNDLTEKKYV